MRSGVECERGERKRKHDTDIEIDVMCVSRWSREGTVAARRVCVSRLSCLGLKSAKRGGPLDEMGWVMNKMGWVMNF